MHDFIRHLSFSPFAPKSGSADDTVAAASSRPATAATSLPIDGVMLSFNEFPAPAFRPSPRSTDRRKLPAGVRSGIV
jgi:hypothetical protein